MNRIYACAEVFTEQVELSGGISILGGFDCADGWRYVGASRKTELTAGAGVIPLKVSGGSGTSRLEDLHVRAAAADVDGGSSIAVVVDRATVAIRWSTLEAGRAKAGAQGSPHGAAAHAGMDGASGNEACSAGTVPGGNEVDNDCGDGVSSLGGRGGQGDSASGGPGGPRRNVRRPGRSGPGCGRLNPGGPPRGRFRAQQ